MRYREISIKGENFLGMIVRLSQNNIERRDRERDGDGGRLKRRESF
jgi:hypothetical protein